MAREFYVLEDEHDGQGWFRPLGNISMYKSEAKDFIKEQHYAFLTDQSMGWFYEEPSFRIISVLDYEREVNIESDIEREVAYV